MGGGDCSFNFKPQKESFLSREWGIEVSVKSTLEMFALASGGPLIPALHSPLMPWPSPKVYRALLPCLALAACSFQPSTPTGEIGRVTKEEGPGEVRHFALGQAGLEVLRWPAGTFTESRDLGTSWLATAPGGGTNIIAACN